jgi:hypothetical protein
MNIESISKFLNNSSVAMNWTGHDEFDCNKLPDNIEVIGANTDTIIFCNNYKEISLKNENYKLRKKIKYNSEIFIEILWAKDIPIFTPKKINPTCQSDIINYKHFVNLICSIIA